MSFAYGGMKVGFECACRFAAGIGRMGSKVALLYGRSEVPKLHFFSREKMMAQVAYVVAKQVDGQVQSWQMSPVSVPQQSLPDAFNAGYKVVSTTSTTDFVLVIVEQ
ncbi:MULTISPECIES: hypothetical protein [Burkholderia]|nr:MULTISPECIES: hypothetical protein [Burkholderia]